MSSGNRKSLVGTLGGSGLWTLVACAVLAVVGLGGAAHADPIKIEGTNEVDDLIMQNNWKIWGSYENLSLGKHGTSHPVRIALSFAVAGNTKLSGVTAAQIDKAEIILSVNVPAADNVGMTYDLYRLRREFVEGDFVQGNPNITNSTTSWIYYRKSGVDGNGNNTFTDAADRWTSPGASDTTYDRYPDVDASFTGPAAHGYETIKVDVTQYVKDVLNGAADYGWVIQARSEAANVNNLVVLYASERAASGGAAPIRLEITTVIPEPAALTVLGTGGLMLLGMRRWV